MSSDEGRAGGGLDHKMDRIAFIHMVIIKVKHKIANLYCIRMLCRTSNAIVLAYCEMNIYASEDCDRFFCQEKYSVAGH